MPSWLLRKPQMTMGLGTWASMGVDGLRRQNTSSVVLRCQNGSSRNRKKGERERKRESHMGCLQTCLILSPPHQLILFLLSVFWGL